MISRQSVRTGEKIDLSSFVGKSFHKLVVAVVFDMRGKEPQRFAADLYISVGRGYPGVLLIDHAVCVDMHLAGSVFGSIEGRRKKCTRKDESK